MTDETWLLDFRAEWNRAPAVRQKGRTELAETVIEKFGYLRQHWFYANAIRQVVTTVWNDLGRAQYFTFLKASRYIGKEKLPDFGSSEWVDLFYAKFFEFFKLGDVGQGKFWLSLRQVEEQDYVSWFSEGLPFVSKLNQYYLTAASLVKEKWLEAVRGYYEEYQKKIWDIFLIINKDDSSAPRYRIIRSLAISPDQRVFLAQDVSTGEQKVVKWDKSVERAMNNWERVREAGVEMIDFSTVYSLQPNQRVLLMERLYPLNHLDSPYEMLPDILRQTEPLHRAGLMHADIKVDNILKREGPPKRFFLIDWDSISTKPLDEVKNSLARVSYSPFWASQIAGHGTFDWKPTSYRYDLEELFYAAAELKKMINFQEAVEEGKERDIDNAYAPSALLVVRDVPFMEAVQYTQRREIIYDGYLTQLYDLIMSLRERRKFAKISYADKLIDYVMQGKEKYGAFPEYVKFEMGQSCAWCEIPLVGSGMKIVGKEKEERIVCSMRCAALSAPEQYLKQAQEQHAMTRKQKFFSAEDKYCVRQGCKNQAVGKCDRCSQPYCSVDCQELDWNGHSEICGVVEKEG